MAFGSCRFLFQASLKQGKVKELPGYKGAPLHEEETLECDELGHSSVGYCFFVASSSSDAIWISISSELSAALSK